MNSEETIESLKKQFLKERKKTAYIFGFISIVALFVLVYAFFQQTNANKARVISEGQMMEYKSRAEKAEKELMDLKEELQAEQMNPITQVENKKSANKK